MHSITSALFTLTIAVLPCAAAPPKPNVLFLAVDDMNDWVGCLETTPRALTPNIDKLAASGFIFTNAHTAGVFCAPSRAAMFSGQYASTTGCYNSANYFFAHPEIEPIQLSFSKAGYQTLGAGKLFHHPAGSIDIRGWSEFFLRNPKQRTSGWPLDSWGGEKPFTKPFPSPTPFPYSAFNKGKKMDGGMFLECAPISNDQEKDMADTIRTDWAVEQLKKTHDQPFFLALGLYAPHFPNYCPQKYFDLYKRSQIQLPPYKEDDLADLPPKIKKEKTARSKVHQKLVELGAVEDSILGYLACMSYADAMLGRVLDALAASPYADNTLIVLWSDHGYHHGEKGDWGKHTLWQRTSRVPFIWAGSGVSKGAKTDSTVSLIDVYPTLVEMCGLPAPRQTLEGQSLAKTLANPAAAKDRDVLLPHMNRGEYAIINKDWRYIKYEDGEELYNLRNDPNEWANLANNPELKAVKDKLIASAPKTFAKSELALNPNRDLVLEGESFHWKPNARKNPKPAGPAKR
jgi:arylsulfatase A-like enzyme